MYKIALAISATIGLISFLLYMLEINLNRVNMHTKWKDLTKRQMVYLVGSLQLALFFAGSLVYTFFQSLM